MSHSPEAGQGLSGYCAPLSTEDHLDSLLQVAVEDNDIQVCAICLCVYIYVCIDVYIHARIYVHEHVSIYIFTYICK